MIKSYQIAFLCMIILSLFSCKKNNNNTSSTIASNVQATIYGQLLDESGSPIQGAIVSTQGITKTTDSNGLFYFNNITTNKNNTTVKATKQGYFEGYRTISVQKNSNHELKLVLMKFDNPQYVDATIGGSISTGNGLSITFPSASFINKNTGTPYNGVVTVYSKVIDPTTLVGQNKMPGNLRGLNTSNEEKYLMSFGMFATELMDAAGNPLQLANGKQAEITYDIPPSLLSSAPSTIPLWHFDTNKMIWIEEGTAILNGNKYVGKVSHFSFWNCDQPMNAIHLEMTLVDQNNLPLTGYTIKLTNPTTNSVSYGITNSNGWVGGLVFANANLTMEVYGNPNVCGILPLYSQVITTNAVNQNLGTVQINLSSFQQASIIGTILNCNLNVEPNSILLIKPYNILVPINNLGNFFYSFPCIPLSPLVCEAYDLNTNQYSSSTINLNPGINNLGNLIACGTQSPYLSISVVNNSTLFFTQMSFIKPTDGLSISYDQGILFLLAFKANNTINIFSNDTTLGISPILNSSLGLDALYLNPIDTMFNFSSGTTNFTTYPPFPGNVEGTFTMYFQGNPSGNTYTATGSFKLPRAN